MFIIAASVLAFAFSHVELPLAKMCCLRRKTWGKYVCCGQIISLNTEMAKVANIEYHWHILRTTNNIHPYPFPSHLQSYEPHSNTSKAISSL